MYIVNRIYHNEYCLEPKVMRLVICYKCIITGWFGVLIGHTETPNGASDSRRHVKTMKNIVAKFASYRKMVTVGLLLKDCYNRTTSFIIILVLRLLC